jgi:T-complex protein 1 subunit eta
MSNLNHCSSFHCCRGFSAARRFATHDEFTSPLPSLSPLLPTHPHLRRDGKWWGVDIEREGVCDTFASGVWEPVTSKINSFASATEAACLILSVDETVKNPQTEQPQGGPGGPGGRPGMGGMAGGKKISAALGGGGMAGMVRGGRGVRMMQGRGGR